jgi:hypothetical protein
MHPDRLINAHNPERLKQHRDKDAAAADAEQPLNKTHDDTRRRQKQEQIKDRFNR